MDSIKKAKEVISLEIEELQKLKSRIDDSFTLAISILQESIEANSKIIVIGVGKSGNIGNKLVATFNATGSPSVLLNPQDALHGDLGVISKKDSIIVISYSGETPELLMLLPHLKKRNIKIISITRSKNSTLGKSSNCVLNISVNKEACPLGLSPTSSTTNSLVLGDSLAMVLMESRGFTSKDFSYLHPGGSLGQNLLLRASDIMRKKEDLVIVSPGSLIIDAISKVIDAKSGAAVVLENQKLIGIFTQGDFARSFREDNIDIKKKKVKDFMTYEPIRILDTEVFGEILLIFETNKIDDLIVTNKDQEVVGIIDIQDVTKVRNLK